jgi:hypothetical protein
MRRIRVVQTAGYLLLVALVFGIGICFAARGVPNLQAPVHVEDAAFYADGGSFHLVVRDANGKLFAVGGRGSLSTQRSEFPIYTQRWWPYLPVPSFVLRGSESELELQRALQKWLAQGGQDEFGRLALTHVAEILEERTSSRSKP